MSIALFSTIGFSIMAVSLDALSAGRIAGEREEAIAYAQEGIEAARQIRDRSWGQLSAGPHGVVLQSSGGLNGYVFSGTSDAREHFTRAVTVETVFRDAAGDIVLDSAVPCPPGAPSGSPSGTLDPDTRRVVSCVAWQPPGGGFQRSVHLTTYLTNWNSLSWTETLKGQFSQGTFTNTEAVNAPTPPADNGSVQLRGSVAEAQQYAVKGVVNFNAAGPSDGRDVAVQNGYAYLVTSLGAGNTRFYVVDVSTASTPTQVASLDAGGKLLAVAVSGSYAYLATDRNSGEVRVVNIANPLAPILGAEVDLPGNTSGLSIAIDGPRLYVGTSANSTSFYVLSLSNPAVPVLTQSISVLGNADVRGISPAGDRVYVATSSDAAEVQVIGPPPTFSITSEDLPGTSDATSIVASGKRAYVTRLGDAQFVVLDITNATDPAPLGSLSLGASANDLSVSGSLAYVSTDRDDKEFQIVNIANPALPVVQREVEFDGDARGNAVSGTCAFVATDGDSEELAIVCGTGVASPLSILATLDLPGCAPGRAVALRDTVALVGTDDQLHAVDVSDPAAPLRLSGVNLGGSVKDIAVSGSYAFVATTNASGELAVVNIGQPSSLSLVGTADLGRPGQSVAVAGPTVLVGTTRAPDAALYVVDVTQPNAPTVVGQTAALDADLNDIALVGGSAAYVALAHAPSAVEQNELRRLDFSSPAAPLFGAGYDAGGTTTRSGSGVTVSGSSIYLVAREEAAGTPEFYILQYASGALSLEAPTSTYDAQASATAVAQYDILAFLTTLASQFLILDVTAHASPLFRNSLTLPTPANGLAVSGSYAYVVEDTDCSLNPPELVIIRGIDAVGYQASGTYVSIPFDALQARTWQRLSWAGTTNGGTMQLRVKWATPTALLTTCAAALGAVQFVGPNDDPTNPQNPAGYYTTSGAVITDATGASPVAQCFQWETTFSGTGTATPVLDETTVNFR